MKKIIMYNDHYSSIDVTDDVYDYYTHTQDAHRHKQQHRGQCRCPRHAWQQCSTDCCTCRYYIHPDNAVDVMSMATTMRPVEDYCIDNDTYGQLRLLLSDDDYRIVRLRVAGYTQSEIARAIHRSRDYVARRLRVICTIVRRIIT